jgi:hypothetical protein
LTEFQAYIEHLHAGPSSHQKGRDISKSKNYNQNNPVDHTRSFATASTTEVNTVAYQQKVSPQEYRLLTAQDPIREKFVDTVGCERAIEFRKSRDDFDTTPYDCGSRISIPNVPHLCCFCESLLPINKRRQSRPTDT